MNNKTLPDYIKRMEDEYRETYERHRKGLAFLKSQQKDEPCPESNVQAVSNSSGDDMELSMLHDQLWSMKEYLKLLGSRITFAKAKEGVL